MGSCDMLVMFSFAHSVGHVLYVNTVEILSWLLDQDITLHWLLQNKADKIKYWLQNKIVD